MAWYRAEPIGLRQPDRRGSCGMEKRLPSGTTLTMSRWAASLEVSGDVLSGA